MLTHKEEVLYRQLVTLHGGVRVLLRTLTPDDGPALSNLYAPITAEEQRYMRDDVREGQVVKRWTDELDYDKVLPLVAMVGERMVGNATLHFKEGPARHRAEVRIFLAKDFRRRGLGRKMLETLIELAKRRGLYLLEAEIVNDQTSIIKAFRQLDFEPKCVLEDYFMTPDGELWDVLHVVLRLRTDGDEF